MLGKICEHERGHWAAQLFLRCDLAVEELGQLNVPAAMDDMFGRLKELQAVARNYSEHCFDLYTNMHPDVLQPNQSGRRLYPGTIQQCNDIRSVLEAQLLQSSGVQKFVAFRFIAVAADHLMHIASMVQWDECALISIYMRQSLAVLSVTARAATDLWNDDLGEQWWQDQRFLCRIGWYII